MQSMETELVSQPPAFEPTRSQYDVAAVLGKLEDAQREGRILRRRIRYPPLVVGILGLFFCAVIWFREHELCENTLEFRHCAEFTVARAMVGALVPLVYLILLPTDTWLVQAVPVLFCIMAPWFSFVVWPETSNFAQWDKVNYLKALFCIYLIYILGRTFWLVATAGPRAVLAGLWCLLAQVYMAAGIFLVFFAFVERRERLLISLDIVIGLLYGCTGFALHSFPDFPKYAQASLASTSHAIPAAAGIAAIVGNARPAEVMAKAESRFRSISLEAVLETQFSSNTPVQEGLGLNQYTQRAKLGYVDAFISHSWHDHAQFKWDALQRWRHTFKRSKGREPIVWIDKFCIDQEDIAEDLLCLPVFLAGCQELVILMGETYLERLWCIMEVLVFLHMGGAAEMVRMRSASSHDLVGGIRAFSVQKTQCSKCSDKDMLLAVVEAGFGGAATFDKLVREMMMGLVQRPSTSS